jgi:hypothetical protein
MGRRARRGGGEDAEGTVRVCFCGDGWLGERRKQAISMGLGAEPGMVKMMIGTMGMAGMVGGRRIDWRSEHTHTLTHTHTHTHE